MTHRHRHAGHSLIELMIALAIALVMLLGLTTVLMQMKSVFIAQDQLAQLQDNERLALTVLSATVRSAGYFPDPATTTAAAALPASSVLHGDLAPGQGLLGSADPVRQGTDTLTARYSAAPGDRLLVNCLGEFNTGTAPKVLINTFSVGDKQLLCSTDGGLTTTPLVTNVTGMSVRYGTDGAAGGQVDRYLDAAQVDAAGWWPRVRTVRLTLNFANPLSNPAAQDTITWVQTIDLMNGR